MVPMLELCGGEDGRGLRTEGRLPELATLRSCGENRAWPRRGEERPGGAELNPEGLEMDEDTPAGEQVRASGGEASRGRVCFVGG